TMLIHLLILPLLCQLSFSQTPESESSTLPSHVLPTVEFDNLAIVKRGASVMGSGDVKIVSPEELAKENQALPKLQRFIDMQKRSVTFDKLADKDRSMTIDGGMNIDEERRRRESAIQMAIGDAPTMSLYGKKKRSAELDTLPGGSSSSSDSDDTLDSYDTIDPLEYNNITMDASIEDMENDIEGSGEVIVETTTEGNETTPTETTTPVEETTTWIPPVFSKKRRSHRDVDPEAEQKIESNGVFGDGMFTDDDQFEGSGSDYPRNRRQSTETVLGDETPVMENSLTAQKRPDDRHRSSTPRPDLLTCVAVECVRGTRCVIENGRPVCKPIIINEPQRSCRDIDCPRDSRCRMERDSRCRGRDCSEQPVCVREERGATCRNVQCPSGLRCNIVEDPNCRGFRCREIATCSNPCDGVRCPFGTSCRFDGFDALCAPIVFNPCLNARCPSGFECRNVQNQAQCFALSTPSTTTPAPSLCAGINEEFASCATFCEPNCAQKNPLCVSACAAPRCQCSTGFYRNHQGVCVSEQQCGFPQNVPSCGLNESFNECSSICEPKCGEPLQLACPAMCGPAKCQCKQGFWRHASGSCVQQNQCFFG
ncbi:hypothetical protein PRIPAC_80680, partial [Pristionchus pacificus]